MIGKGRRVLLSTRQKKYLFELDFLLIQLHQRNHTGCIRGVFNSEIIRIYHCTVIALMCYVKIRRYYKINVEIREAAITVRVY